ncbi:MAG: hypothetical protein ACLQVN_20370 [Bryobacteraceae bacterium]
MPQTDSDREAVQKQLERILSSPYFKGAIRTPALLRVVVQQSLSGHPSLKERTLGIEVFGREPAYDTNLDPVVRVTASRLRHRLAQYYEEPGHETEIRILLPPGSYTPIFQIQDHIVPAAASPESVDRDQDSSVHSLVRNGGAPAKRFRVAVVALRGKMSSKRLPVYLTVALLAAMTLLLLARPLMQSNMDRFWGPVLNSPGPILICVGGSSVAGEPIKPDSDRTIVDQRRSISNMMTFTEALTLSRISGILIRRRKPFQVQRASNTPLALLRSNPAVLIGSFNNVWVLRLNQQVRFRFERGRSSSELLIVDAQNPTWRDWKITITSPLSEYQEDYGVITRLLDPTTERPLVIAGGLGSYGTVAAGEFLSGSRYMDLLASHAPSDWGKKNFQVILKTVVIDGNSGPPKIVRTYFW